MGVLGQATAGGIGIRGMSSSGTGLQGEGGTYGVVASGALAPVLLRPSGSTGAPAALAHSRGEVYVDAAGSFFKCTADGTPGAWVQMNNSVTLATPVRAYDSRSSGGPLRAGDGETAHPRAIPITGVVAGIPSNAVAVFGNLAVTQGVGVGFATVWPSGSWPGTANINFATADLSNSFTVGLSATGTISVAASQQTHVVIDVTGFIA
jgi:hypothetical protein